LVLIVEELLSQLRNNRVAQRVRDDRVRNAKAALLVRPLFQNPRYSVKFCWGLAGVGASLRQRYSKLVDFNFTRQLTVHTDNDAVIGFEVLNGLVSGTGLLTQFANPLFEPFACSTRRFEFCLQL